MLDISKFKSLLVSENMQAGITYTTSGSLISAIFAHMNGILQGVGLLVGIAIGVQRLIFDRVRFRERQRKRDREMEDDE